ncbi:MAG: hybrid sensor histidine kinase/response regulator, partial [Candidatus Limivivens sp.]|nr:hybrid sensor histidine kinase/response regulator [Candidatus Limivivens sp.]
MDIKRRTKEKWIRRAGVLLGICVAAVSLYYSFHAEKADAEKRMVEIVNYVKVQCSTYTHYNEASESKSLLRAIESARQTSMNIDLETENGGQLNQEFLKENLRNLWMDGILVLDTEGRIVCEYSVDETLANEISDYIQKDMIMEFTGYEERIYSERINRKDGSYIDLAACARKDAPGIVVSYYHTSFEFARNYNLTIQNLLSGYSTMKDGTIIVADEGTIIASNNESLLGQKTADNEVVQAMKMHTDSQHIFHLKNEGNGYYGIMLRQRDYYIYTYLPDTVVFHNLPLNVAGVIFLYFL